MYIPYLLHVYTVCQVLDFLLRNAREKFQAEAQAVVEDVVNRREKKRQGELTAPSEDLRSKIYRQCRQRQCTQYR
jgi:hypothetical protein